MRFFEFLSQLWTSPWTGWVGLRYLKSKKNSRFLSFITLLSMMGVAVGVTAMIVVLSVMDGFEAELKKRLMGTDLHILITPTSETVGFADGFVPKTGGIDLADVLERIPDRAEVQGAFPVVSTEAILKVSRKVTGVELKSFTPERFERLQPLLVNTTGQPDDGSNAPPLLGAGTATSPGVFVGQELAYDMGLVVGDSLTLISPTETEGPMSSVPRLKKFSVSGIYRSGLPEQELHTVFASEGVVDSFLRRSDVLSRWELTVKDFDEAPKVASEIARLMPGYQVQDWIQLNQSLFWSLRLERVAMFVILAFIVVVASFNIVTTLTLMVLEKKREISIMRAMGAREGSVAAVFLAEGLLIGGVGVGGGVGLGWLLCLFLRKYNIVELPDVFYDRTLPVTFDIRYYLGVAFCAIVIVLFACFYPSKRAARLDPLEGIRFG